MQEWASITFVDLLVTIGAAFWIMIPAYVPNSAAAALGGGTPIDLGRNWRDNRRIFGNGKTIRGFAGGVSCGILAGILQIIIQSQGMIPFFPEQTFLSITLLAVGALLGDLVKSFFKRRRNMERGASWPVADQYDLVCGAFLLLLLGDPGWILQWVTLPVLAAIIIITPLLHRGANIIGYLIGVKQVPW